MRKFNSLCVELYTLNWQKIFTKTPTTQSDSDLDPFGYFKPGHVSCTPEQATLHYTLRGSLRLPSLLFILHANYYPARFLALKHHSYYVWYPQWLDPLQMWNSLLSRWNVYRMSIDNRRHPLSLVVASRWSEFPHHTQVFPKVGNWHKKR